MKWERVQFLTVTDVILLHDDALAVVGGSPGILKPEGLEGAVLAPQATFAGQPLLETLVDIAAAYVFYLVTSHPFADGNKRTAIVCAAAFLGVNGHPVDIVDQEEWADVIEKTAKNQVTREELAELFAGLLGDWVKLDWR